MTDNGNILVSTLAKAALQMAGKQLFCKLDHSDTIDCLRISEQNPVEKVAIALQTKQMLIKAEYKCS